MYSCMKRISLMVNTDDVNVTLFALRFCEGIMALENQSKMFNESMQFNRNQCAADFFFFLSSDILISIYQDFHSAGEGKKGSTFAVELPVFYSRNLNPFDLPVIDTVVATVPSSRPLRRIRETNIVHVVLPVSIAVVDEWALHSDDAEMQRMSRALANAQELSNLIVDDSSANR